MSNSQVKYLKDYRQPDFQIDKIELTFELDEENTKVTAKSTIRRQGQHNTPLTLDGEDLQLISVKVNGIAFQDYQQTAQGLLINVPYDSFELEIENVINPAANSKLEGLYQSDGAFCTQCEAEGFRRITYFLDRPDVLSEYFVTVIGDKAYPYMLSNGNKVEEGELADGRHFVKWHDPHKKPCYLFALVAGDFDVLEDHYVTSGGRNVALQIFVDKGNLDRAEHAMISLKKSMRWDEDVYGLEYDLDIYMIVAVDFFNMGAMENKGLNVFNSAYVLANPKTATDVDYFNIEAVIGHEYFHNWTGNRVTCRDWFQLSLKEGLTVFRDQSFSADMGSSTVCRIEQALVMRNRQFAEDASPMSHPIRPESVMEMNNFYTLTVYDKGAEVIRMMHTLLGAENYRKGIDLYFQRHDGQAVTCDDFVAAMEDASGKDLTLFRRWYSQSGTPELTVSDEYDANAKTYTLNVKQHTASTQDQQEKQALHIPLKMELIFGEDQQDNIQQLLELTEDNATFVFENIKDKPVASLLGDFSAPVKLNCDFSDEQLQQIIKCGQNEFSRWDAVQSLLNRKILSAIAGNNLDVEAVVEVFKAIIADNTLDTALKAEMLSLPAYFAIAELMDVIDVDGIVDTLQALHTGLASALSTQWKLLYQENHQTQFEQSQHAVGQRKLKHVALTYLAHLQDSTTNDLIEDLYRQSTNMTDTMGGLIAAQKSDLTLFESLMNDFESHWGEDGLVMDKWFRLQAMSDRTDICETLEALKSTPVFSMQNPNRVRALIGSFAMSNPKWFHNTDGSGYDFLTEHLKQLNTINPQIAARLIEPMIQFKRHTDERQALLKARLSELNQLDNLSKDLKEKIGRALA